MKKTKLILLSALGSVFFGIATFISIKGFCFINYICDRSHDDKLAFILFPIIPLFIFSLITYKMQEEVFQFWWKFSRIWIPFSMFAILISPSTGNWMIPIEKGSVALFSMILFTISSVFIIVCKHFQLKK